MKTIKYITGDVREPIGEGRKLIVHCCNDLGAMGSGVALALLKKWPEVRSDYIEWSKKDDFKLGEIKAVNVDKGLAVINMIGQHDIKIIDGVPPVRYNAVESCLEKVAVLALKHGASIHMPYLMCCDRAGGKWEIVEKIINEKLCSKDIEVTIYDIENKRSNK